MLVTVVTHRRDIPDKRAVAIQAENTNGVVFRIPRVGVELGISNGALKIGKDALHDAEQWGHDNPPLFVAVLVFLLLGTFFRTQRYKARANMKRDFKAARDRNRQPQLPFPRHGLPSSPSHGDDSRRRSGHSAGEQT